MSSIFIFAIKAKRNIKMTTTGKILSLSSIKAQLRLLKDLLYINRLTNGYTVALSLAYFR